MWTLVIMAAALLATDDAAALFAAQNWPKAAAAYEKVTWAEPGSAVAWYRLGVSRHHLEQYDKAVEAYAKAESLQPSMRGLAYNLACAQALGGRADRALEALSRAIEVDFITPERLKEDADLQSLRDRKEFAALLDKADRKVRPCEHDLLARQFDFWVGEWEVFTPQGSRAGHNKITRTDNGCLLLEEWTGGLGGTGRSLNFYDATSGKWNQVWVDSTGNILRYEGGFQDGAMVMIGHPSGRSPGQTIRTSWSALPDGRVRHASDVTSDGGKTWEPRFELLYTRSR
ncbi:MAG: tetratricopeptide repeat protein [Candidatus Polarisedimenticolia bacterium]